MATHLPDPTPSAAVGTRSQQLIHRRGGFGLTPELVDEARAHVHDQAVSGQRRRDRLTRVDPRYLAVLTDYATWLEVQLEAEEEAHNATHARMGEIALERQREVGRLLLCVSQARSLLLRRPRWRVWRWRGWWQAVTEWVDPPRREPGASPAPSGAAAPSPEAVDG